MLRSIADLLTKFIAAMLLTVGIIHAADVRGNVVYAELHDEISHLSVQEIEEAVDLAEQENLPIFIDINSPGGSIMSQMQIMSLIRTAPVLVKTHVSGLAASAAAVILAAGDERSAVPGALILTHYSSMGVMSPGINRSDAEKLIATLQAFDTAEENELMVYTKKTREEVQKYFLHKHEDVITEAFLAVERGLIDRVTDDPLALHPKNQHSEASKIKALQKTLGMYLPGI